MKPKKHSGVRFKELDDGTEVVFLEGENTQVFQYHDLGDFYSYSFVEADKHVCRIFHKNSSFDTWQGTSRTLERLMEKYEMDENAPMDEHDFLNYNHRVYNLPNGTLEYQVSKGFDPETFEKFHEDYYISINGEDKLMVTIGLTFLTIWGFLFLLSGDAGMSVGCAIPLSMLGSVLTGNILPLYIDSKAKKIMYNPSSLIDELESASAAYNKAAETYMETNDPSKFNKQQKWLDRVEGVFVDHFTRYSPTGLEVKYTADSEEEIEQFRTDFVDAYDQRLSIARRNLSAAESGTDGEFGSLEEVTQYMAS